MDGVALNVGRELFPDRSGFGLRGVRRSHHLAQFLDGVVGFEHHRHNRPFRHEFYKTREERALFMHVIEAFGLGPGQVDHLHGTDTKAFLDEAIDDETGVTGLDAVGFENRKSSLHVVPLFIK